MFTIPVSLFGSLVCLLLSIVIHLLIRLIAAVSEFKTDVAVLNQRVRNLEHKSALRSQPA